MGKPVVSSQAFFLLIPSRTGSGEFLLVDESKPEEVKLVVRTINSSAFSDSDWKDLIVNVRAHSRRQNALTTCSWIHLGRLRL